MTRKLIYGLAAGCLLTACGQKAELTMLVGTYTDGESQGIYTYRFNQETGESTALGTAEVSNPSYLAVSPDNNFVYAVSEHNDGNEAVNAFSFDEATGQLTFINKQEAKGGDPCHIATDGKYAVTANYTGGSLAIFPIATDGSLKPSQDVINFVGSSRDEVRQASSHLHCIQFGPDGKQLFATDLGSDNIYKFNTNPGAEKFLSLADSPMTKIKPGSGPRHLTFAPNGKYAYLINELQGTVIAFKYDKGELKEIQNLIADDQRAGGAADIHVSPDGKHLYISTRLRKDGITIFTIDPKDGTLAYAGKQLTKAHPRGFAITPNGKYLLVGSRDEHAIQVFKRDAKTGLLSNANKDINVNKPVCIKFAN